MESPNPESVGMKRKRSPVGEDSARQAPAPPPGIHPGNVTQINYLVRARGEQLRLIEGDSETFADVLGMIDDYEGVLQRHESLAANLGAKLVGPLLLKSFEKLFDGPIKIIQTSFPLEQSPITWLDIVTFARSNPLDFNLSETAPGIMACQFWIKGGQVEISDDDFRLIMSGGPERMIPTQAIPEDESLELSTLNILEARLAILIKKADAVASKARQLNYHLKGRKTAVLGRKAAEQPNISTEPERPFSSPNTRQQNPANGETVKIQQQLLEQFLAGDRRQSSLKSRSKPKQSEGPGQHNFNGTPDGDARRMSHPHISSDDGNEGQYRIRMAAKIEKLAKGEMINPPCDRCRRLKFECTKHLTACSACTKKHAKCSWKDIKETELHLVPPIPVPNNQLNNLENGYGSPMDMDPMRAPIIGMTGPIDHGPESRGQTEHSIEKRGNDHATLTQIASAAAAAGNR